MIDPTAIIDGLARVWSLVQEQAPGTLIGIAIGFLLGSTRGTLARRILGTSPKLRIEPNNSHDYWAHIEVANVGLPLARKTRPARNARATAVFDAHPERTLELCWSSADKRPPPLEVDIHKDRPEQIPFVLFYNGVQPVAIYSHSIDNVTAFITEVEFLTQGSPKERSVPGRIGAGDYPFTLTVRYDDMDATRRRLAMHVRTSPLRAWVSAP